MTDPENNSLDGLFKEDAFLEKEVRMGFIKKVYGILTVQLAITVGLIALFIYVDEIKEYSQNNEWLWITAFVMTVVILIGLAVSPNFRRRSPLNMILLVLFTFFEGVLLGSISSHFDRDEVLIAVGITALVSLALTIFAFQTKIDFTMMGGLLFVLLIVLIVFGLLAAIFNNRILDIVYAALGALIFAGYLVVDTQLMLGGKLRHSLSPEEYIFATLNLYLDIVNMFLTFMTLVASLKK